MITIVEFEDFVKYMAKESFEYIESQFADGEFDCISVDGNHKDFDAMWHSIAGFRETHKLPYIIYGKDGEVIGYHIVDEVKHEKGFECETTGRFWKSGWFIKRKGQFHKLRKKVSMTGFRGVRYVKKGMI